MSTQKNKEKGNYGEDLAVKFLRNKGYEIVARNWYAGHNEIDIIAKLGELTVFVEVKLRHDDSFGNPEDAVNKRKQNEVKRAADEYIHQHHIEQVRIDIIAIILQAGGAPEITHFEDAFF